MALFLKSLRSLIKQSQLVDVQWLLKLKSSYADQLSAALTDGFARKDHYYAPDEKVLLKDLTKTNLVLQIHPKIQDISTLIQHLKSVLSHQAFHSQNIDYVYKFIKATYSKIKCLKPNAASAALLEDLSTFLIQNILPALLNLNDEHYCKVLEYVLKVIYRINKTKKSFKDNQLMEALDDVIAKFAVNANLVGLYIKLVALMVDGADAEDVKKMGRIARKYAYAD